MPSYDSTNERLSWLDITFPRLISDIQQEVQEFRCMEKSKFLKQKESIVITENMSEESKNYARAEVIRIEERGKFGDK